MRSAALALALVALGGFSSPPERELAPAAGRFLVASRDLGDPNFMRTVVVLTRYDDTGAMGLVINRRTKMTVAQAFEDLPEAKGRTDVLYSGGPVERSGALGLVRARTKPAGSLQVLPGVFMISSKDELVRALRGRPTPDSFRLYVGYSGWGAGQLEREIEAGAWRVVRGDVATVFDPAPESLWNRLAQRGDMQIAWSR